MHFYIRNKEFHENKIYKSGNSIMYLNDKIFFIQMINEADIKKYRVQEYDIQPIRTKRI